MTRKQDPNSLTRRIVACCNVERGLAMGEIITATSGHPASVNAMVPMLVRIGQLHRVGTHMVYRYFAQAAHAEAYALVFPMERAAAIDAKNRRRRENYNAKRAAGQPARVAKPKASPKPKKQRQQPAKPARKAKHGADLTIGPKNAGQSVAYATTVTWPAHVQVQRAPTPRDDRFAFNPPPGWRGELMQEWLQRRGAPPVAERMAA